MPRVDFDQLSDDARLLIFRSRDTSPRRPMSERKQINFTVIPDESDDVPRTYANFCAILHTPFDFTLTFCEVLPPSEKEVREAETQHELRAPVRARIVVPMQFVPNLITALQEHLRSFSEGTPKGGIALKGSVH